MTNAERLTMAVMAAIIFSMSAYGTFYALALRECLRHGWPDAKVDITLTQYCIKRVDQTDVVRPLRSLRLK